MENHKGSFHKSDQPESGADAQDELQSEDQSQTACNAVGRKVHVADGLPANPLLPKVLHPV